MINISSLLGNEAESLLGNFTPKISKESLMLPGADFIDNAFGLSDRSPQVLRSLHDLYNHGRLSGTGYLSILPVDQDVEHSANASFSSNPEYFNPENIIKLAINAECSAVATTFGILSSVARKYVGKIPFIVKLNHNETMSFPQFPRQIMFGSVEEAWNL